MNKKGYQTSEFWLTATLSFLGLLNQSGVVGHPLPVDAIGQLASVLITYIGGRSAVKAAVVLKNGGAS